MHHVVLAGQALAQLARPVALDPDAVRVLVDQAADLVDVALGQHLAAVDDDDLLGQRLDLVQHVARHDHGLAAAGGPADALDDLGARDRVDAGQRLVEDEQRRVVHQALGQLGALAHALGEAAHPAAQRFLQAHLDQRALGVGARAPGRHAGQLRHAGDPLQRGQLVVQVLVLGAVADAAARLRRAERLLPEHLHLAARRAEQPDDHLHQRRLAGAVGPEQPDDAAAHGPAHVRHAQHVAVPLRAAGHLDDGAAHG